MPLVFAATVPDLSIPAGTSGASECSVQVCTALLFSVTATQGGHRGTPKAAAQTPAGEQPTCTSSAVHSTPEHAQKAALCEQLFAPCAFSQRLLSRLAPRCSEHSNPTQPTPRDPPPAARDNHFAIQYMGLQRGQRKGLAPWFGCSQGEGSSQLSEFQHTHRLFSFLRKSSPSPSAFSPRTPGKGRQRSLFFVVRGQLRLCFPPVKSSSH